MLKMKIDHKRKYLKLEHEILIKFAIKSYNSIRPCEFKIIAN